MSKLREQVPGASSGIYPKGVHYPEFVLSLLATFLFLFILFNHCDTALSYDYGGARLDYDRHLNIFHKCYKRQQSKISGYR